MRYTYWILDFKKMPTDYQADVGFGGTDSSFSYLWGKRSGNTLYWYASIGDDWQGSDRSSWQFNKSTWRYNYVAIG